MNRHMPHRQARAPMHSQANHPTHTHARVALRARPARGTREPTRLAARPPPHDRPTMRTRSAAAVAVSHGSHFNLSSISARSPPPSGPMKATSWSAHGGHVMVKVQGDHGARGHLGASLAVLASAEALRVLEEAQPRADRQRLRELNRPPEGACASVEAPRGGNGLRGPG